MRHCSGYGAGPDRTFTTLSLTPGVDPSVIPAPPPPSFPRRRESSLLNGRLRHFIRCPFGTFFSLDSRLRGNDGGGGAGTTRAGIPNHSGLLCEFFSQFFRRNHCQSLLNKL